MSIHAALDIGSNSIKLLVLDLDAAGGYTVLWNESRVTRLGTGINQGGWLHPRSIQDSLACLRDYLRRIGKLQAESVRAVATSALREAVDAAGFIERVRSELGLAIEVLSGEDEAEMSRVVALRELPPGPPDVVFFDVGGNSTEISWCREGQLQAGSSLLLGARRCTEAADVRHPLTPSMHERLVAMIANPCYKAPFPAVLVDDPTGADLVRLAGLGGTATSLVWLLQGLRGEGISDAHLAVVTLAEVDEVLAVLRHRPLSAVRGLPNLDPDRADVIYAGVCIIGEILRHYRCSRFVLTDRGLRFGVLLA